MTNMKKTAIIMLMLGILSFESFAQSRVGTFSIIPKIGTNIASITNNKLYTDVNDKLDSKSNTGLTFGVDLQYQATDRVALSAGIGYSRQGYRYDDTKWKSESESTTEYDVYETWTDFHQNIDYLTIPVMVKYYLFPNFTIGAGVQAGFILDNKCSYEVSSYKEYPNGLREYSNKSEVQEIEFTNKTMNAFDLSIPISASYEYMNVVVAATYNLGMTRIFKAPLDNCHNRVVSFTVGYKFDL